MRHTWLPIVLAALFGLRAPLCVAACGAAAAPSQAAAAEAPCHGAEEPTSAPEPAEHECECGSAQLLVAQQDAQRSLPALASVTIGPAFLPMPSAARAPPSAERPAHALPTPNLLLHHATLLL